MHISKSSQTLSHRKNVAIQFVGFFLTKSSQTVLDTQSKSIQAISLTSSQGTQTNEQSFKTISIQTDEEIIVVPEKSQPPEEKKKDDVSHEEVQTICFLNKIGEGLLSQNGLIQNNSTLLSKMADFLSLLKDPVHNQNDESQIKILLYVNSLVKSFKNMLPSGSPLNVKRRTF